MSDNIQFYHYYNYVHLKIESNEEPQEIDYINDILYFDFETFQEKINHNVYAAGFILNGKYDYFYGRDALKIKSLELINSS